MIIEEAVRIKSHLQDNYPLGLDYTFDDIGSGNVEDIIWQNVVDSKSEIVQNEIGVGLTQSYQYSKLHKEKIILTKWAGVRTVDGPEFRIMVGRDDPNYHMKDTPTIMSGNLKQGVVINTDLTILHRDDGTVGRRKPPYDNEVQIGVRKGYLCIKTADGWRKIKLGDEIL